MGLTTSVYGMSHQALFAHQKIATKYCQVSIYSDIACHYVLQSDPVALRLYPYRPRSYSLDVDILKPAVLLAH